MHRPRGGAAAQSGLQESARAGLEMAGRIYKLSWGHCKRALVLGRFLLDPPGPSFWRFWHFFCLVSGKEQGEEDGDVVRFTKAPAVA